MTNRYDPTPFRLYETPAEKQARSFKETNRQAASANESAVRTIEKMGGLGSRAEPFVPIAPGPEQRPQPDFLFPHIHDPARARRARRARLIRLAFVLTMLLVLIGFAVMLIAGALSGGGRVSGQALRRADLVSYEIEPLGRDREQAYAVPLQGRAAFEKGFDQLLRRKPMIVHCRYQLDPKQTGYYHYWFWYKSVPDGAHALFRLARRGHSIRSLGAGAVSECPRLLGEAWDKSNAFQALVPPAAQ